LRELSGNWLAADYSSSFRVRASSDLLPPDVTVTLNDLADARKRGRTVPKYGFEILVNALDPLDFSLDMSSTEVELTGPGNTPDSETIFASAEVDGSNLRWTLDEAHKLQSGQYTLLARVSDLSGNVGVAPSLTFNVKSSTVDALPFERTHVVWARFDLDRNGNGTSDFEDDLIRLGLITQGDPLGTNDYMVQVVRDGILAQCNQLYERKSNGGRQGRDSVSIRFTHRRPVGVARMQIACGGLDPEGAPGRSYGD
ncbi:MAG: Ig-like domain-containing protein, partial [Planctomycetota bacterium]